MIITIGYYTVTYCRDFNNVFPFPFGVTKLYLAKESENLVPGQFPNGHFPNGLFSDKYFIRDSYPNGQFPEQAFLRWTGPRMTFPVK